MIHELQPDCIVNQRVGTDSVTTSRGAKYSQRWLFPIPGDLHDAEQALGLLRWR